MSKKSRVHQPAKSRAPAGQSTAQSSAKSATAPSSRAAQQTVNLAAPTSQEGVDKLQALADLMLRIASQVNQLSARQEQVEKLLVRRDEASTSGLGGQAESHEAKMPPPH